MTEKRDSERRETCKAHEQKTEELRRTIFGHNGYQGLKYELVQVKADLKLIKMTNKIILSLQFILLGLIAKIMISFPKIISSLLT